MAPSSLASAPSRETIGYRLHGCVLRSMLELITSMLSAGCSSALALFRVPFRSRILPAEGHEVKSTQRYRYNVDLVLHCYRLLYGQHHCPFDHPYRSSGSTSPTHEPRCQQHPVMRTGNSCRGARVSTSPVMFPRRKLGGIG
jgi:hypothetical protein